MPTLVILHHDLLPVSIPLKAGQFILVAGGRTVNSQLTAGLQIKNDRYLLRQRIAGLGIFLFMQNRLQLICRRRFHIIYIPLLHRYPLTVKNIPSVRGPQNLIGIIAAGCTILRQYPFGGKRGTDLMNHDILSLNIRFHLSVRRGYRTKIRFFIYLHPVPLVHSARPWSFFRLFHDAQSLVKFIFGIKRLFRTFASIIENILSLAVTSCHLIRKNIRRVFPLHLMSPMVYP